MIGSGGSIAGMLRSLRNNERLLRRNRLFKKDSSFQSAKKKYLKAAEGKIELKKATPHQLKKIREAIRENRRKEIRKYLLAGFVTVILALSVYKVGSKFLVPENFNPYKLHSSEDRFTDQSEEKKREYLYFIAEGDKYIKEKHWHNAIFQYSKALKLFPREFEANYRLALAYTYSCNYDKVRCSEAKNLVDKLKVEFTENQKIHELKAILGSN